MDPLESVKITFFQECDELLESMENDLLRMEQGETDRDTIDAVFRAVHSIKGGAGAFSLDALVEFAHVFETVLDDMRSGKMEPAVEPIRVMLRAKDVLADLVEAAKTGAAHDETASAAMAAELQSLIDGGAAGGAQGADEQADEGPVPDELGFVPMKVAIPDFGDGPPGGGGGGADDGLGGGSGDDEGRWAITFRPLKVMYANANDAVVLLRELGRLGDMTAEVDASRLPSLDALDPEESYLSWRIELFTEHSEAEIREIFDFVEGDCELTIEKAGAPAADAAPEAEPEFAPVKVEIDAPEAEPAAPAKPTAPAKAAAQPKTPQPAPQSAPQSTSSAASAPAATIRVDLDRVDRLINLVGELVINQAMLAQRVSESELAKSSTVSMGLDELEQLTREIQDSVMAIRAQPVRIVFQRMSRVARECASATGKQVRLVTEGEGTEVDKTVIERLSEPITHMLRNSVDHGLETTEKRLAAGKPAEGVVRLSARHQSGRIVIEVADDGAGINRERVFKSAVDKGLIPADAPLSDEEIDNLIFMPGFSTAESVSNISGRGVGMDVVKRSIHDLGGRVSISSEPGKGATFSLSLPLTLAVLDGMVVTGGDQTLVAPLTSIIETLQPKADAVRKIGPNRMVLKVRDAHVPLVDVGVALGWRSKPMPATEGVALLVESEVHGRAALLVDQIQGQRQVVIKSLEANYQHVDCIAAATILGDGRVALIIDVDATIASSLRGDSPLETKELLAEAS
ncbi:MAG: chemotaxis protein CheA [Maricaulaceae bacterium]|jgi:two-component system chemotaxis sensor kinase CheA